MYRTIDDFFPDWEQENKKTDSILAALTDDALDQRATAEGRTLRTLAWHLVTSISEMMGRVQLHPAGPGEDAPEPSTAAEILAAYRALVASLSKEMRERWTDEDLDRENDMYGATWKNAQTLQVLLKHEIHHRAQLTVFMRLAGLRVPGVYGPSKEEWSTMGMEPLP